MTNADVIVLNENSVSSEHTLAHLQNRVSQDFYYPTVISDKRFHCFCRNRTLDLSEVNSGFRTSVRKLRAGQHRLLLALVHGVDPRNYDAENRMSQLIKLMVDIEVVKEQQGTSRLIFLGDFNMNPYDSGMNLASGLNAMMTKECVKRGYRTYGGEQYDLYYNPMWGLFGDNTKGPAGTVYDTSSQGPYGWSMFDQVIIHHSAVELFEDVEILDRIGTTSLANRKGHPDSSNLSDHFPILVKLGGDSYE